MLLVWRAMPRRAQQRSWQASQAWQWQRAAPAVDGCSQVAAPRKRRLLQR